ncbi:hypothetical protein ABZ746_15450 [Streptomyces sp. NPDC020096]
MTAPQPPGAGTWHARQVLTVSAEEARCLCLSPDGTGLLVVHEGQAVRYDDEGRTVWSVPWDGPPPGTGAVPDAAAALWSREGDWLLLLGGGRLLSLDADTGEVLALPDALHTAGEVTAVDLAPDGRVLAAGLYGGDVLLLDRADQSVTRLRGLDPVTEVRWRPGSGLLYVATATSVQLWETLGRTMTGTLGGAFDGLRRLACSPDGRLIAVEDYQGLRLLDPVTGKELARRFIEHRPSALTFGHDGALLAAGSARGGVQILGLDLGPLGTLSAQVTGAAELGMSGSGLIAARLDPHTVAVWEPPGAVPRQRRHRHPAALRRWANAMGVTVGRIYTSAAHQDRAVLRPQRIAGAGAGCVAPVLAWSQDGGGYWYESGPGRIVEHPAVGTTRVAEHRVPGPDLGWYDAESLGGPEQLLLAAHCGTGINRLVDPATGRLVAEVPGGQAVAADPVNPRRWAVPEPGEHPVELLVHDLAAGSGPQAAPPQRLPAEDGVRRAAWSPDGRLLAAGTRGRVLVWEQGPAGRWRRVRVLYWPDRRAMVCRVAWSPDGSRLAATAGSTGGPVAVWDTASWGAPRTFGRAGGRDWAPALSWCADSRLLAFPAAGQDSAVEVWDTEQARQVRTLLPPEGVGGHLWTVKWSPVGDQLATTYNSGAVVLWDLFVDRPQGESGAVPPGHDGLALLGAAAAASGSGVPLSLLSDLLALLRGDTPPRLRTLAGSRGLQSLRELGWPAPAQAGLVLLLVSEVTPEPAYLAPDGIAQGELADALGRVLAGSSVTPRCPAPPLTELTAALQAVDERLLGLLRILGPEAVAADPTLPARLRRLRLSLTPPGPNQRALLGLRLLDGDAGLAVGANGGTGRSGLARHGPVDRLLPTQLALPEDILTVRHIRDELLYRTSSGRLPPDPHGLVLLLDDTPATHGKVGSVLRLSAHLMAAASLRRQRPCAVVPLSEPWRSRMLLNHEDLVHLWATGALEAGDVQAAFREVDVVGGRMGGALAGAPRVILLSHPYLEVGSRPGLRELRVHYPRLPWREDSRHRRTLGPDPAPDELRATLTALLGED